MSEHRAEIDWKRTTSDFSYETYNRDHEWTFDAGITLRASAAPEYFGSKSCLDPEKAFVASLSSCHMLTFLAVASSKNLVVDSYHDAAVGHLEKNAEGRLCITRVILRPRVVFGGERTPGPDEIRELHDKAHHHCLIANSVKTDVTVEPQ